MMIDWPRLHDEAYRQDVLERLMRDYETAILRYCTTWLGAGLAEEVTQNVFVTAWVRLPTFRPRALEAWLFGIARNQCKQVYRNRARRRAIDRAFREDIRQRVHAVAPHPSVEALAAETPLTRLRDSLAQLRDEERLLLNLRYAREQSVAEIAEMLGKSEAAVRKRLDRAKQRLREMMHHAPAE